MDKDSRIFVAGGAGMVGSATIRRLKDSGYSNIVSNCYKKRPAENPGVSFHELDLRRQAEVEAFFAGHRPEFVFLCAAKVGGILANSTYKAEFIYDNMMIAANVIEASFRTGVKKLLNLGSSCIYPKFAPQPMKEEHLLTGVLEPTNEAYAIAKISAIKLCRFYNEQYGTNFISLMPTNLYGQNDNFNLFSSHVLPALIRKIHLARLLKGKRFDLIRDDFLRNMDMELDGADGARIVISKDTAEDDLLRALNGLGIGRDQKGDVVVRVWGSGNPRREFLHVDDLAAASVFLMERRDSKEIGEFVNIGTGVDLTINELVAIIKGVVGFDGIIENDLSKPDGTPRKLLDVARIKALGWSQSIPLERGIRDVYAWYTGGAKEISGQ
ncbi:MAG: GDP-L-fucose synthase [Deltaproteobacteria bacterium]